MACYNTEDPYNKALENIVGEETAKRYVEMNGGHPLHLTAEGKPDTFFNNLVELTGKVSAGLMGKIEKMRNDTDLLGTLETVNNIDRDVVFDIYDVMDKQGLGEIEAKAYANFGIRGDNVVERLKKYLPVKDKSITFEDTIKELPLNPAYEVMRQERKRDRIADDIRINFRYSDKFKC